MYFFNIFIWSSEYNLENSYLQQLMHLIVSLQLPEKNIWLQSLELQA